MHVLERRYVVRDPDHGGEGDHRQYEDQHPEAEVAPDLQAYRGSGCGLSGHGVVTLSGIHSLARLDRVRPPIPEREAWRVYPPRRRGSESGAESVRKGIVQRTPVLLDGVVSRTQPGLPKPTWS